MSSGREEAGRAGPPGGVGPPMLLALFAALALALLRGVPFWLALAVAAAALTNGAGRLLARRRGAPEGAPAGPLTRKATVAVATLFLSLAAAEAVLALLVDRWRTPLAGGNTLLASVDLPPDLEHKVARARSLEVLPLDWVLRKRRDLKRPGDLRTPYEWHGALHVFDETGLRRREPFPPRDPGTPRVVVVGDSFTYGEGVPAEWTYAAQLERLLSAESPVEVLALGLCGFQAEDLERVVVERIPALEPDLVVYGVCLNDLLPAGVGFVAPQAPLPGLLRRLALERTRLGPFLHRLWMQWLIDTGRHRTFYEDILPRVAERRAPFRAAVAGMNRTLASLGLPPLVAMVLDARPSLHGPAFELARIVEEELESAGATVVPVAPFYERFDGCDLRVSRWENHPNEAGHALYAQRLFEALTTRPELAPPERASH